MRSLFHILMLFLTASLWSSCQDVRQPEPLPVQFRQAGTKVGSPDRQLRESPPLRHMEAHLSDAMSLCRLACNPESRVESRTGESHSPTSRGGGKAFVACRAPRSTIHQTLGGFVQRTTVPIRSFASHTLYIYVLRHILR